MINIVPKAFVVHTPSRSAADTKTDYDPSTATYDEDTTTYYGIKSAHSGDGSTNATVTDEHTWSTARTIKRVHVIGRQYTFGGNYKQATINFDVYLRIGSTWTNVHSTHYNIPGYGSNTVAYKDHLWNDSTGWANVTGIRYVLYGYSYSYEGTRSQYVTLWVYQTRAYYAKSRSYAGVT